MTHTLATAISLDNVNTLSTIVLSWLTILSLVGAFVAWISKLNRRKIEEALKAVQVDLKALKQRHLRVLVYARKLYDVMKAEGLKPPEPPEEFYE